MKRYIIPLKSGSHTGKLEITLKEVENINGKTTIDLTPAPEKYWTVSFVGEGTGLNSRNRRRSDCDYCGQCYETLLDDGLLSTLPLRKLCDLWERWHLNDLCAGTRAQRDKLRHFKGDHDAQLLCLGDLEVDRGYKYGSQWLVELVPDEVIKEICDLARQAMASARK